MSLGEKIRKVRKEKGLTLVQLGELTDLTQGYLSNIEGNKRKPSPEILEKLSKALDIQHNELMEKAGYVEEESDLEKIKKAIHFTQSQLFSVNELLHTIVKNDGEKSEIANIEEIKKTWELHWMSLLDIQRELENGKHYEPEFIESVINSLKTVEIQYQFEPINFTPQNVESLKKTVEAAKKIQEIKRHDLLNVMQHPLANYEGVILTDDDKDLISGLLNGIKRQLKNYPKD